MFLLFFIKIQLIAGWRKRFIHGFLGDADLKPSSDNKGSDEEPEEAGVNVIRVILWQKALCSVKLPPKVRKIFA